VKIKGPIRSILYAHKAIRTELDVLRDITEKLDLDADFDEIKGRVNFLSNFVDSHAKAEEEVFYPAVDELRRDTSKPFNWDHKLEEKHFQSVKETLAKIKRYRNPSNFEGLKWNVYALSATLSAHAQKEDDLLVPILDEEVDPGKQGEMVGKFVSHIPPHLMEKGVKWIIGILSPEERVDYLGIIKRGIPPEKFDAVTGWVRETVSEDEWKELLNRMA